MNRNKRKKHRNPAKSPIVVKYNELSGNEKAQKEYLASLNRKARKKIKQA